MKTLFNYIKSKFTKKDKVKGFPIEYFDMFETKEIAASDSLEYYVEQWDNIIEPKVSNINFIQLTFNYCEIAKESNNEIYDTFYFGEEVNKLIHTAFSGKCYVFNTNMTDQEVSDKLDRLMRW